MNILKRICQALLELGKQVSRFPQSLAGAVRQGRRQTVLDKAEAERLDRIRNPDKYLGKESN